MVNRIVLVGASLGGLHALGTLLSALPGDFPWPLVVVQHRSKDGESTLSDLLQLRTALSVLEVEDKAVIEPGRVFVAPADYHLLVGDDRFSLSTEAPVGYARPSIDVLFDSAADSFGPRAIGVVLTGANQDGSIGAAAIKRVGGLVVAQDPAEAESPAMPLGVINRGLADAVLSLSRIATYLISLSSQL
jgi:two-component system chemotaxis response regulator CheB